MTDDSVPDRYTALDAEGYKTTELSVISDKSPSGKGRHVVAHCISKDFAERLASMLNAPPQTIAIAAREITNTGTIGGAPTFIWIPVDGAPAKGTYDGDEAKLHRASLRVTVLEPRLGLRVTVWYEEDPDDRATFKVLIDRAGSSDSRDESPWLTPNGAMPILRRLGIRGADLHMLDEALEGDRSKFDLLDLP